MDRYVRRCYGQWCCYWPITNAENIKHFLSDPKSAGKKNVPWSNRTWQSLDILFQRTRLRVNEHLHIFEHGPIFSCLTTTTIFQRGCHMNGARLHIYWTLKNFRCENLIEKKYAHAMRKRETVSDRNIYAKLMKFGWSEASCFFFVVVAPFLDRVLLYFAKMGQNQSNSCNESPFNLLAYCRNDFHSRQFGDRKFLNCIFKLALEWDRPRVWGQECVFSLSLCVCFYVSI